MKTPKTNADFLSADLAANKLPKPTAAALEDRDGFRFVAVKIGELDGDPVFQWELLAGSGYMTGYRFRRPWIHREDVADQRLREQAEESGREE